MLIQKIKRIAIWNFLCFITISCTKDIDIYQINDFEISPVIESSLVYLSEPATRFSIGGAEVVTIQDSVEIDVFNNSFVVDNLIKAEFVLETTNSINRGLDVQIDFLDTEDQLRHTFTITVAPSPNNEAIVSEHTEVFEGSSLDALKQTTKLKLTLRTHAGDPIDENSFGEISLRSKGIFYLNIDNEI